MDVYIHTHVYVCGYVLYIYISGVYIIYTQIDDVTLPSLITAGYL